MTDANVCKIRFIRTSQYADMLRTYQLRIDGRKVGTIARDDAFEVRVLAGDHVIEARIDWARSKPLAIRAAPGETVEIEVRNRWGAWAALWGITFGKNSYLALTEIGRELDENTRRDQASFASSASTRR